MNLREVKELLNADVLVGEEFLGRQVKTCCGCDLMSDVLAFTKRHTLLCTGLTNVQIVRTADVTDLCALIIVRGKIPSDDILTAAYENKLPILSTKYTLFEACGILYQAGLKGCSQEDDNHE